jgi:hypothetical protein
VVKGSQDLGVRPEQTGDQHSQQGDHDNNRDIKSDHTSLLR